MDAASATEPHPLPAPPAPAPAPFAPVAEGQRIEALDVVRGFALLGIFLMNIEWFNRPFGAFNEGIPRAATGLDWLATWFVNYFVAGKFWTIFSLLFGMGFAVMLVRAERAGREFTQVYLRRILALAVFGAVHYIFIWQGDILFSYAVGALALLIVLYGRARPILIGIAVFVGLGFIPDAKPFFAIAAGLAISGLLALYLRGQKRVSVARRLDAGVQLHPDADRRADVPRRRGVLAAARRAGGAARPAVGVRPAAVHHRLDVVEVPRAGREAQPAHGRQHLRLRRRRDDGGCAAPALHARPGGRGGSG